MTHIICIDSLKCDFFLRVECCVFCRIGRSSCTDDNGNLASVVAHDQRYYPCSVCVSCRQPLDGHRGLCSSPKVCTLALLNKWKCGLYLSFIFSSVYRFRRGGTSDNLKCGMWIWCWCQCQGQCQCQFVNLYSTSVDYCNALGPLVLSLLWEQECFSRCLKAA